MIDRTKLTDQLREAIQTADKSAYRIAKETGINKSTISRFLARKGGLSMEGLDRLGECLNLSIKSNTKKTKTAKSKR